ncbi:MAG: hypothetical protein AB7T06_28600 [Kofleriaceae bacterium]
MSRDDVKIPRDLRDRIQTVAVKHGLGSTVVVARHFVTRGLDKYGAPPGSLDTRIEHALESQGYSSAEELVEHLLLRGLRAYEEPAASSEELAARLRGLGYID